MVFSNCWNHGFMCKSLKYLQICCSIFKFKFRDRNFLNSQVKTKFLKLKGPTKSHIEWKIRNVKTLVRLWWFLILVQHCKGQVRWGPLFFKFWQVHLLRDEGGRAPSSWILLILQILRDKGGGAPFFPILAIATSKGQGRWGLCSLECWWFFKFKGTRAVRRHQGRKGVP